MRLKDAASCSFDCFNIDLKERPDDTVSTIDLQRTSTPRKRTLPLEGRLLGVERSCSDVARTAAWCQEATFTAFLDGMDSGTALGYSPFSGRNPWSVASPQSWSPMWSAIFAEDRRIVEEEQKAFDLQGADWNQAIFPIIRAPRSPLIPQGVPLAGAD